MIRTTSKRAREAFNYLSDTEVCSTEQNQHYIVGKTTFEKAKLALEK